jgi:methylglutaconyl-CoA hydratase
MNFVKFTLRDSIGYITLCRSEKRNALNAAFIIELKTAFREAEQNPLVKLIVINAEGDAFCAGADLEYMASLRDNTYEENLADSTMLMELFHAIYTCEKITLACVEGPAIAGGCGLATVCDFVFCTPESLFGYPEVKIGFVPALVSVFLVRRVGEAKAKELLLTGELIVAESAQKIGLVNYIVDPKTIQENVFIFASGLCKKTSLNSVQVTKKLILEVQNLNLHSGLELAAKRNAEVRESADFKKGLTAFLKKEKPLW